MATWLSVTFNTQNVTELARSVKVRLPKSSGWGAWSFHHPASLVRIDYGRWTATVRFPDTWEFRLTDRGDMHTMTAAEFAQAFHSEALRSMASEDHYVEVTEPEPLAPAQAVADMELRR